MLFHETIVVGCNASINTAMNSSQNIQRLSDANVTEGRIERNTPYLNFPFNKDSHTISKILYHFKINALNSYQYSVSFNATWGTYQRIISDKFPQLL